MSYSTPVAASSGKTVLQGPGHDRLLITAIICLIAIGLIMVSSASMVISDRQYGGSFHYLLRQSIYLGLGLVIGFALYRVSLSFWEKSGGVLLCSIFVLLTLVLIPGIGHQVNGSMRWLGFAGLGFQVSELAKLFFIIYLAGYLQRHGDEVRNQASGFIKPFLLLLIIAGLLLSEPDFGATVVIFTAALGMLFIAGVKLRHFLVLVALVGSGFTYMALTSAYRLQRLTSFLDPWANQFGSGYQLTQSLIAFGRGSWFGVGLGDSIQKLFYLPEAHTDFLFAVIAEELGLFGILVVMGLFILLVACVMRIAYRAFTQRFYFAAYLAFGFGLWLAFQAMVNMGVNLGVLPTKGLTLPFISYGGSSMLVNCMMLGILFRIDHESRKHAMQDKHRGAV